MNVHTFNLPAVQQVLKMHPRVFSFTAMTTTGVWYPKADTLALTFRKTTIIKPLKMVALQVAKIYL